MPPPAAHLVLRLPGDLRADLLLPDRADHGDHAAQLQREDFFTFTPEMLASIPRLFAEALPGFLHQQRLAAGAANSLLIAPVATILSVALGTLAAIGLSPEPRALPAAIMAILISPMIVPLIISAAGMYFFYSPDRDQLQGTYWGVVLAMRRWAFPSSSSP
jgi:putative spermidine/putrescine transport system permease protein